MTLTSAFTEVPYSAPEPLVKVLNKCAKDQNPNKIDVTIGVYMTEDGDSSYVFPSVKQAKQELLVKDPGHCYTKMSGIPEFIRGSQNLIFGEYAKDGRVASIQTISGTGSLHIAFQFLKSIGYNRYYLGNPSWVNYYPMIESIEGEIKEYQYYDDLTHEVDFESLEKAIGEAEPRSAFLIQLCGHNPTGVDYSKDQWRQISKLVKNREILLVLDSAYLGFASGSIYEDSWAIRYLYEQNHEFLVCQSYSKNMGLYSERSGVIHVVLQDTRLKDNVESRLVAIFRNECSFAPAYGARIGAKLLNDDYLNKIWGKDVYSVYERVTNIKRQIFSKLTDLETPGNWEFVTKAKGLFWFSGLNKNQVNRMMNEYSIYMSENGRVNIAGLNSSNIDYFCYAINQVVSQS